MRGKKDVISLEPGQKAKIEVVFKNTEHTCFTVIYLSMKIME